VEAGSGCRARWDAYRESARCLAVCAASLAEARRQIAAEAIMPITTTLLPFQPDAMTPAQLAACLTLLGYSGHTHELYAYQLRRWFCWLRQQRPRRSGGRAARPMELYVRHLRGCGLRDSSICTMMHGVRGFFRFARRRI
jgi:Phage integrase, N-terminal SAM-like domain